MTTENPRWFDKFYRELALPLTKFVVKRVGAKGPDVDEIVEETFDGGLERAHVIPS